MEKIEYRVRPVTRYVVTRYEQNGSCGGVSTMGEYENEDVAYQVGYALCKAEHQRLGWHPGDERIQYPTKVPRRLPNISLKSDGAIHATASELGNLAKE